jgi:ketosteroid isomerase-like protein
MTKEDLLKYFENYNAGRYEEAVEHYADDAVFIMPGNEPDHIGKANILKWFKERGAGYTEKLTPKNILLTPNTIAVELTAEYEAYEDVPDFPIKPLKKGEKLSREDGAFYDLKDGKITRVCIYVR